MSGVGGAGPGAGLKDPFAAQRAQQAAQGTSEQEPPPLRDRRGRPVDPQQPGRLRDAPPGPPPELKDPFGSTGAGQGADQAPQEASADEPPPLLDRRGRPVDPHQQGRLRDAPLGPAPELKDPFGSGEAGPARTDANPPTRHPEQLKDPFRATDAPAPETQDAAPDSLDHAPAPPRAPDSDVSRAPNSPSPRAGGAAGGYSMRRRS